MNRKEFEEKFCMEHNIKMGWKNNLTAATVWQWIEQYAKEQIKESHKCAGCEKLIYYQYHCQNCKRLLET